MLKLPKKDLFVKAVVAVVALLFIIRLCFPVMGDGATARGEAAAQDSVAAPLREAAVQEPVAEEAAAEEAAAQDSVYSAAGSARQSVLPHLAFSAPSFDFSRRHRIRGVVSYRAAFPDVQDVQFPAAVANGVPPVANRAEAEGRKRDLLFVGVNPYYEMDPGMNRSIPYLVPKASLLLQHIGRRFLDSLAVKGVPLHKIIVTSVLRTEDDVRRLKRVNGNVSEQSCHRFGTTFDISYNRYHTVCPPDDPQRRAVRSDSLKYILCEVLRDARQEGRCYVKYEVKQGCFHVTVR
ncbi:MAG: hypothetical protein IJ767_00800 [Bacteroidaceae bacterium]|nr:hypothetical protein [Bacteroidaceae bacterium]MBR1800024.1 hypothetical protein [Bacteroidaceae bacterium]